MKITTNGSCVAQIIIPFCVVGIAHIFCLYISWVVISFQWVKGILELCVSDEHHKANMCSCGNLLKTYAYYLIKNHG